MLIVKDLLSPKSKMWLEKSIHSELYASNLYKHIGNNLQRVGFFGGQKYYLKESADELSHYQIIVEFCNDMGWVAPMPMIEAMKMPITCIEDALREQYKAEYDLLEQYEEFYDEMEEEDCIVAQFLLQFIEIQRKSVGEVGDLIARYNRCGMNEAAILEFDEYLSEK
jgi:ferritin